MQSREKLTPLPSAKIDQLFLPIFHAFHYPPNLPPLLFRTSTGNLNFNLTTSARSWSGRLNFKWEVSLGHKGREIRQGCSDHRSPPPSPSLLQPPIEHRRCCHPPPLSRGVHLQFLAQIALEPHLITPRYLSNVSLPSQEGKFPNFFLPGITNSSLQFLLTDNFPSRGELFIVYYPIVRDEASWSFSPRDVSIRENENFSASRISICGGRLAWPAFFEDDKKRKKIGVDIFVAEGGILVPLEERNLAGQPISLSRS